MHCALITAAGAKARVIISKTLWKRIEMLFHNVLWAIQELNIIIIIITMDIFSAHAHQARGSRCSNIPSTLGRQPILVLTVFKE